MHQPANHCNDQHQRWTDLPRWTFSRRDAAERLGICVRTLDAMVKRGDIKMIAVAGRRMIPIYEMLRIMQPTEVELERRVSTYDEVWLVDHPHT